MGDSLNGSLLTIVKQGGRNAKNCKCGLIQASTPTHEGTPLEIKALMIEKHIPMIKEAGEKGVQILCLQEIFHGPYFCCEQDTKWYQTAEKVPGPITDQLSEYAKKYQMVMVIPVYEETIDGVITTLPRWWMRTANILGNSGKSRYLIPGRAFSKNSISNRATSVSPFLRQPMPR